MFTEASQMEPMRVSGDPRVLSDLAIDLIRKSASLSNIVHPKSQVAIISLALIMMITLRPMAKFTYLKAMASDGIPLSQPRMAIMII